MAGRYGRRNPQPGKPAVGIDFGTSNTVAVLNFDGDVVPVEIDTTGEDLTIMPTLMFYNKYGRASYGNSAVENMLSAGGGRFLQGIKRVLPIKSFEGTKIGGQFVPLEQIIAGFLFQVREKASRLLGEPIDNVLMGRPAVFNEDPALDSLAQSRLASAAMQAGFRNVAFQLEPIAAARSFEKSLREDVLCLVGDFGGGTSDFTVMRLSPRRDASFDRSQDVFGSAGVRLGGHDFDSLLIRRLVLPYFGYGSSYRVEGRSVPLPSVLHMGVSQWHNLARMNTPENLMLIDKWIRTAEDSEGLLWLREFISEDYGFLLFQQIEAVKKALSSRDVAAFDFGVGSISIEDQVRRSDFERDLAPAMKAMESAIDKLLAKLQLKTTDIDVVFLTGGSSRIPMVQNIFRTRFGNKIASGRELVSVGEGLGVEAGEVFRTRT